MSNIKISAIVAMAKNNIIGKDNALIWHLPADLKHFKATTMGKPLIMGRKSFDSLPGILPGRPHIVISRAGFTHEDERVHGASSIAQAIKTAQNFETDEIFIAGGGQIYAETLPIIERLYLTLLDRDYDGDTLFPIINWDEWNILSEEKHKAEPENDRPAFTIYVLDKKSKPEYIESGKSNASPASA